MNTTNFKWFMNDVEPCNIMVLHFQKNHGVYLITAIYET